MPKRYGREFRRAVCERLVWPGPLRPSQWPAGGPIRGLHYHQIFPAVVVLRWRTDGKQPHGPVVQFGVHAGLSSRRSRVQIPSGPQPLTSG
jgi:hypothetical protein